jgi:eukaryotic-like serine/threonine-protein kinase
MPLAPGTQLGPYQIGPPLGAGGMGEVYRARAMKRGRDVALKVLPAAFASVPERMARFQREAQVLASLNHPRIGSIYGFEDSGGVRALVMELMEGPALADRIARGSIPVDEALPIAREIAEALEAAHERGIVHRDLKPANPSVMPALPLRKFYLACRKKHQGRDSPASHGFVSACPWIEWLRRKCIAQSAR